MHCGEINYVKTIPVIRLLFINNNCCNYKVILEAFCLKKIVFQVFKK